MTGLGYQFLTRQFHVTTASSTSMAILSKLGLLTQLQIISHRAPRRKVTLDTIGISRRFHNRIRVLTLHPARVMAESPSSPEPSIPRSTSFDTVVLEPKGKHKVTVVFLHGLASSGDRWAEILTSFNQLHPSIKWIVPTAPFRKVDLTGEFCNAWYNATPIFEEGHFIDLEGLDESAERVADLFSSETAKIGEEEVKLVVGGFSQGCATALYINRCLIVGKYSSGKPFPLKQLDAVIALGGWMPTIKTFEDEVKEVPGARQRAQEIPMFLGHCEDDNIMPVRQAHAAASSFRNVGVKDITVQIYREGGHTCIPEEAEDLCAWMVTKLALEEAHTPELLESNRRDTKLEPDLKDDVTCP